MAIGTKTIDTNASLIPRILCWTSTSPTHHLLPQISSTYSKCSYQIPFQVSSNVEYQIPFNFKREEFHRQVQELLVRKEQLEKANEFLNAQITAKMKANQEKFLVL